MPSFGEAMEGVAKGEIWVRKEDYIDPNFTETVWFELEPFYGDPSGDEYRRIMRCWLSEGVCELENVNRTRFYPLKKDILSKDWYPYDEDLIEEWVDQAKKEDAEIQAASAR